MTTVYTTLHEQEQETITRHAVWALLAGIMPMVDVADCGIWADRVKTLMQAFESGGKDRVDYVFNLMMADLDFSLIMIEDPPSMGGQPAPLPQLQHKLNLPTGALIDESVDDEGNAQCVKLLYGDQFLYCDAYGYLFWTGTHWQSEGAEALLGSAIVYTIQQRHTLALRSKVNDLAKFCMANAYRVKNCEALFKRLITVQVSEFDSSPRLLNCANGIVDLANGQLTPHDPTQRFTYCVPIDYDPAANQRTWKDYLAGVVGGGNDVIEYLQQAIGYSLTGFVSEECLFYIHGPTRSGKGTFSETILALIPRPLATEVQFNTFTATRDQDNQNFDLAPLKPSRVIFASESNKHETLNTAVIKSLTGGNEVRCAFKHRDHFSYKPQFKFWLISNHPVNADVDDDAAWARVRVIEFPTSFLGHEDKRLKARMLQPDTLKGVLAWAVEGAIKWHSTGKGLVVPQAVADLTVQHRQQLDFVGDWLSECCKPNAIAFEPNRDIYASYKDWCVENGITPKQQRSLTLALKAKGMLVNQQKKNVAGKNQRGVIGLEII